MKTMKKIERLGRKFEVANDMNTRTSLLRRMMCLFLNLVFYIALRAIDKKFTKQDLMKSCKPEDRENIIEETNEYIIVEWKVVDKKEERAKSYNVSDIYLYCKFIFNKNGVCKRIEVE